MGKITEDIFFSFLFPLSLVRSCVLILLSSRLFSLLKLFARVEYLLLSGSTFDPIHGHPYTQKNKKKRVTLSIRFYSMVYRLFVY